jgi:predicted transcriptional regulator
MNGERKLKCGRPFGVPLTEQQRDTLYNILNAGLGMSCRVLAKKIGITQRQLYMPLRGLRNCSLQSHKKILRFIERHCSKEVV